MTDGIHIDFNDPAFKADPFPLYARLREEAPVRRVPLPDGRGLWLVTRYDDILSVFKDPRFVKNFRKAMTPEQIKAFPLSEQTVFGQHMLTADPPDHTRLRALVQKAFSASFVERMRGRIQEIADQLLDAVAPRGQMDLIEDYAYPLPILVIAEMLGAPSEDRGRIRAWSNAIISVGAQTREVVRDLRPYTMAFAEYVRGLCEARRKAPGNDLISGLIHAEEEGEKLSEPELIAMIFLLLVAGHETTVNLIGNGMLALFHHPRELAKLKADPSLLKPAVEEILRYDGPVETSTSRFTAEDVELGGVVIPRGEQVLVVLTSANRDRAHFDAPDELDITRPESKHLAFGYGVHYCVGAPLARLEGQIALGTLLQRMPDIHLAAPDQAIAYRLSMLIRGAVSVPVVFTPPRASPPST